MSLVLSLFNSPSVLQGNLENLQEISSNLMQFVKKMRNNLSSLEKQQDQIITKSKDALKILDQEIQSQFDRLEKQYPQKIEVTIKSERKEVSRDISNPDKILVKQPNKVKRKSNTKNRKQTKQIINTTNNQIPIYIPNRRNTSPQPYSCFICLWQQKKDEQQSCHWNELSYYLQHLQNKHNITPSLNILLFGCYNSLPFSHVKINGKYYHLFKNHQLQKYQYIINSITVSKNKRIFICGCSVDSDKFQEINSGVFINHSDFQAHNKYKHGGLCYPNSTHALSGSSYYQRKKVCSQILQQENIQKYLKEIERMIIEYTKTHSIQDLVVQTNPISRLEIISRMSVKWNEVFLPIRSQQQDPTRIQILDYGKIVAFDLERKLNINGMNEEQSLLLNTQINLLRSNVFICADCQKIFKKDTREFIVHVQSCQHYSPLNSHKLCFL